MGCKLCKVVGDVDGTRGQDGQHTGTASGGMQVGTERVAASVGQATDPTLGNVCGKGAPHNAPFRSSLRRRTLAADSSADAETPGAKRSVRFSERTFEFPDVPPLSAPRATSTHTSSECFSRDTLRRVPSPSNMLKTEPSTATRLSAAIGSNDGPRSAATPGQDHQLADASHEMRRSSQGLHSDETTRGSHTNSLSEIVPRLPSDTAPKGTTSDGKEVSSRSNLEGPPHRPSDEYSDLNGDHPHEAEYDISGRPSLLFHPDLDCYSTVSSDDLTVVGEKSATASTAKSPTSRTSDTSTKTSEEAVRFPRSSRGNFRPSVAARRSDHHMLRRSSSYRESMTAGTPSPRASAASVTRKRLSVQQPAKTTDKLSMDTIEVTVEGNQECAAKDGEITSTTAEKRPEEDSSTKLGVDTEAVDSSNYPSLIPKTVRLVRPYGLELTTENGLTIITSIHPDGSAHDINTKNLRNARIHCGDVIVGCDKIPNTVKLSHEMIVAVLTLSPCVTLQLIDGGETMPTALKLFSINQNNEPAQAIMGTAADDVEVVFPHIPAAVDEVDGYFKRLLVAQQKYMQTPTIEWHKSTRGHGKLHHAHRPA